MTLFVQTRQSRKPYKNRLLIFKKHCLTGYLIGSVCTCVFIYRKGVLSHFFTLLLFPFLDLTFLYLTFIVNNEIGSPLLVLGAGFLRLELLPFKIDVLRPYASNWTELNFMKSSLKEILLKEIIFTHSRFIVTFK